MKIRRWSVAGLAAVALLVPGIAACGSGDGASTGSDGQSVSADPKAALLASTTEIAKGNYEFTMAGDGAVGEGVVHAPSRSARMTMTMTSPEFSMKMEIIYIDQESWVKVDLGELAKLPGMEAMASDKYMHLDQSKISNEDLKADWEDADLPGAAALIKAIIDVEKTGEGAYSGTIDLSKATDSSAVDDDLVKELGANANALPFTAKLDAQGRLAEFAVDVPAAGDTEAHEIKITYANFGSATGPQKPAASEIQEAPAEAYEWFN